MLENPLGRVPYVLACQEYVELIRAGKAAAAVEFVRREILPFREAQSGAGAGAGAGAKGSSGGTESDLEELAALVAYRDPLTSPAALLLSRRQQAR